jgi:hypothetical protein
MTIEEIVGGLIGCFIAYHFARILDEPKRGVTCYHCKNAPVTHGGDRENPTLCETCWQAWFRGEW